MSQGMSRQPATPLIAIAMAGLVMSSLGACASDYEDNQGVQCVKKVDANSPNDETEVEVVDSRYCDEDGNYAHSHGGGFYFISTGGGYYNTPVGTRYHHSSSSSGGKPLISSTDSAARSALKVAPSFKNGTIVGKTTVRGGFGGGGGGGSVKGGSVGG